MTRRSAALGSALGAWTLATGALLWATPERLRWDVLGPAALVAFGAAVVLARQRAPLGAVLLLALGARAASLATPSARLSDDLYRYLWDGRVAASGVSPYAHVPADSALAALRDGVVHPRLNSPRYHSVYPPVSQAAFWTAAQAERRGGVRAGLLALRLLGALCELAALLLLLRRARRHAVWRPAFALYALHPLVVVEAGQGHTELYALPLVALAVLGAGGPLRLVATVLAGWVKLVPLAFLPFVLRGVPRRERVRAMAVGGGVLLIGGLLLAPYAREIGASLRLYASFFEFNALPYRILKSWAGTWTGGDAGPLASRALLSVFALFLAGAILWTWRRRRPLQGSRLALVLAAVWTGYLAASSTVHPWYLLPVLLLAALAGPRADALRLAVGWLAAGALGTYLHYTTGADAFWTTLGWIGAFVLLLIGGTKPLLHSILRVRANGKVRTLGLDRALDGRRVLDLGAGEGYVGEALARRGAAVTLADVADFHRVPLPFVRLDEAAPLPFAPDAFTDVVLVFVLHHAADPARVLAEALRVAPRAYVLESVYDTERERRLLDRLDRLANRLRTPHLRAQEERLHFRRAEAWAELARSLGAAVSVRRLGRWPHKQAALVLERAVTLPPHTPVPGST